VLGFMKDIAVYAKPDVLEHKKKDGWVYWQVSNLPKNAEELAEEGRIYFAVKGQIVGYFEIEFCSYGSNQIGWHSDSWVAVKNPLPTKPFQGFKYIERGSIT
jgi:hypothetical protein